MTTKLVTYHPSWKEYFEHLKISLTTDTKLSDAIRLYQRYGFPTIPYTQDPRYQRGNVRMELSLASN